ncbi:MAG: hypothetical protein AMJ79_09345 [Phycisphaerae bacterium SM23_30]|nr:MAG: hypothetical protein AMJ79_09345 [Phycisphaerae bacterium SM23_30]
MISEKNKTVIIFSHALKDYDFGRLHPFRGDRFTAFLKLYQEVLGNNGHFVLVKNEDLASDEELGLILLAMRSLVCGIFKTISGL